MPLYLVNKNLIPYLGEKSIQTVSPQKMNKNYHAFKMTRHQHVPFLYQPISVSLNPPPPQGRKMLLIPHVI